MKFEDILHQIGDEDRFQIWIMVGLLLPTSCFNAFYDSIMYMSTPDHWCKVPELEHLSHDLQHELIRPKDNITGQYSTCERYDLNYSSIQSWEDLELVRKTLYANQSLPTTACTNGWLYDQSLYRETAVTWFNFVCTEDYNSNNILSLSLIGLAVLTPILSNLSDRIGRRKTLLITFVLAEMSCLSPLLSKNVYSFIIARFLSGGVLNVYYQLPFVMTQEIVSQRYRTRASCLSAMFYSFGSCLVPLVAKLTGHWVYFSLVQLFLTLPFIFSYRLLPESPFWLISTKKYDEAYEQLVRICEVNRRPVPENLMKEIQSIESDDQTSDKETDSFTELFLRPSLRWKTLILTLVFVACLIGYGGIAYNTINMEAHNQLYNFLILSMVDIPALLLFWYLVDTRFGRRWSNVFGLALCGIALVVPAFVLASNGSTVVTVCTVVGKFGIAGTYMVVYQHASELFPTTLRNQGIGICATISSLVGISVPQLVYIAKYGTWVPLSIIGVICLVTAFVASFLPETLNEYLPQQAKDSDAFGVGKSYFSLATTTKTKKSTAQSQNDEPVLVIKVDDNNEYSLNSANTSINNSGSQHKLRDETNIKQQQQPQSQPQPPPSQKPKVFSAK